MIEGPLELGWLNLLTAGGLIIIALALARAVRSGVALSLAWAGLRTLVQLLLLGYILTWIFEVNVIWVVLGAFLVMLSAAGWTAARRPRKKIPGLLGLTTASLAVGSGVTAFTVCAFVIRVDPWWDPQYFLPLGGMIIGNSMNAVALACERLQSELASRRDEIEELLSLGATPRQSVAAAMRATFKAAFLPLTNMMLVAGLVSIPGMMNGQIIAGADPVLAARYQVMVMYMIAASVTICAVLAGTLLYRRFFTAAWQLQHELLPDSD